MKLYAYKHGDVSVFVIGWLCSRSGHSSIVRTLLARNADCTSSDSNGASPLHYAAQNNFAETVDVFLSHPTLQDWADNEGRTALMWAASKGADDVVQVFVKHKRNVEQTDKNGGTGLWRETRLSRVLKCEVTNLLLLQRSTPQLSQDIRPQ